MGEGELFMVIHSVIRQTVIAWGLGMMLPKGGMFYKKLFYYRVTCDQQGHMAIQGTEL